MREISGSSQGARIAIVDDDESMREAIETLIRSMGLSAKAFSSAEDFLTSSLARVFDCLILDVRMPGMTGVELQRQLISENRAIPIVFITAYYREEDRTKAIQAGAVDFLSKPFTERELLDAITRSLTAAGHREERPELSQRTERREEDATND
jgi:FixJ family two-component response regulator